MASKAFMLFPDGSRKLVNAVEVSPEDRDNKFLCAGITTTGEVCEALVKPADTANPEDTYFYVCDRKIRHKPGCSYCRERTASIIGKLDRSGEKITFGDLYDRINRDKRPLKPKGKGTESDGFTNPEGENEPIQEDLDPIEKKVQQKKRNPRDCHETIELLRSLKITDRYAGRLVFDLILDDRTVEAYKRLGKIPVGRPFVVTLRKAIPQAYNINLEPDEWLLKDYWGKPYKEFLFILKLTPEAKEVIWNICNISPAVQIRIWAVFYPHPTLPGAYVSEVIKPHMICADVMEDAD